MNLHITRWLALSFLVLIGCANANEQTNRLLVESADKYKEARELYGSGGANDNPKDFLKSYQILRDIVEKIEGIPKRFPSSDLAVRMLNNPDRVYIGDANLSTLRALIDATARDGLYTAVDNKDANTILAFFSAGVSPDHANQEGMTPLMFACLRADPSIVDLLIKNGASVSAFSKDATTPLILAVRVRNVEIIRLLLKAGAEINFEGNGKTALLEAVSTGDPEIMAEIKNAGGTLIPSQANNALLVACQKGDMRTAEFVLDNGADVNLVAEKRTSLGIDRETPLILAARYGHLEMVTLLIRRGANVNYWDRASLTITAYDEAHYRKHTSIENVIRAAGGKSARAFGF